MENLQLGVRAHDLDFVTPEELCKHVHQFGLNTIQLAIQKAFPMYAATLPDVTLATVQQLAATFAECRRALYTNSISNKSGK